MLLEEAKRFAEQRLFPLNIAGDRTELVYANGTVRATPGMRNAYGEFVQGWLADDVRGVRPLSQGLPEAGQVRCARTVSRGELSVHVLFVNLTHDAAKLIVLFGTDEQKSVYMTRMYRGDWTGTMCLTEPGAGSEVGALRRVRDWPTTARTASEARRFQHHQRGARFNGEHRSPCSWLASREIRTAREGCRYSSCPSVELTRTAPSDFATTFTARASNTRWGCRFANLPLSGVRRGGRLSRLSAREAA